MRNCYNEAINYLKNKYGFKRTGLTSKAQEKLSKARNKKERKEIEDSFTERDYQIKINSITEKDDEFIMLLIQQYYYGNAPKKELYNKLIQMGIINGA